MNRRGAAVAASRRKFFVMAMFTKKAPCKGCVTRLGIRVASGVETYVSNARRGHLALVA